MLPIIELKNFPIEMLKAIETYVSSAKNPWIDPIVAITQRMHAATQERRRIGVDGIGTMTDRGCERLQIA